MGDENPIRTLGDYSRPSHEGYRNTIKLPKGNNVEITPDQATRNTIELPEGNNVVPLRSDTIRLVQNGCSFHGIRSENPNQHLKDFLKLCEIDRAAGGKLRNKSADESWEIIENLALYDHEGLSPQPQALNTTFKARVRDYMAAHTERMERFENTIFKQREEINGKMTKMFGLLKELTTSRTPEKVLIREEAKFLVTKNLNYISLTKGEEGGSNNTKVTPGNAEKPTKTETKMPVMEVEKINEVANGVKLTKTSKNEEVVEAPGSDVNVMPYSTYTKLTDEKPAEIDIRLSLANHSYIYPLGITEDVLVEIAEHVYPVDFEILDISENENRPFILGTPFLTTAKASIKFDTSTIILRSRKHKVNFHRKPDSSNMIDKGVKNDIEPIAPTMTVNRLVLEWEEKIKLHLEKEMQFNQ
ncbi:MAK10-like protein [Tanacetum coccineum]